MNILSINHSSTTVMAIMAYSMINQRTMDQRQKGPCGLALALSTSAK
jgi:hypothetical protein